MKPLRSNPIFLQVSTTSKNDDEEESGPPSKRDLENNSFKLETGEPGQPFYVLIKRISSGRRVF